MYYIAIDISSETLESVLTRLVLDQDGKALGYASKEAASHVAYALTERDQLAAVVKIEGNQIKEVHYIK